MGSVRERTAKDRGNSGVSPWLWHIQTRGVVTPSDFMTEEEKASLSGPVVTYVLPKRSEEETPVMDRVEAESPKTPSLTREKMESLIKEGRSTSQMAQIFGVSRGTINNKKRMWGLVRAASAPAKPRPEPQPQPQPEKRRGGQVQLEVIDSLEACQAEHLLKNIASFISANGGEYEITLRISKVR